MRKIVCINSFPSLTSSNQNTTSHLSRLQVIFPTTCQPPIFSFCFMPFSLLPHIPYSLSCSLFFYYYIFLYPHVPIMFSCSSMFTIIITGKQENMSSLYNLSQANFSPTFGFITSTFGDHTGCDASKGQGHIFLCLRHCCYCL